MMRPYQFCWAVVARCIWAVSAAAEFKPMAVRDPIEVNESVQASDGTMSGGQRHTIRTNKLFAAFQLITKDEANKSQTSRTISVGEINHVPIQVPSAVGDRDLFLCAEIKTINGFYEAVGTSTPLEDAAGQTLSSLFVTKKSGLIDGNYTEDLMLLRGFVAPNCAAGGSSYFVPMYFNAKADTFLAVFEIGNASITASLHGVIDPKRAHEEALLDLHCTETIRVDRGYDCTFDLSELKGSDFTLYELQLKVKQAHHPDARLFRARVPLPPIE